MSKALSVDPFLTKHVTRFRVSFYFSFEVKCALKHNMTEAVTIQRKYNYFCILGLINNVSCMYCLQQNYQKLKSYTRTKAKKHRL